MMKVLLSKIYKIACLCSILVSAVCCADSKGSQTINSFFREIAQNKIPKSYDLRTVIPAEWERVCIGYFPYAPQSHIEEKLQGKVKGNYKVVGDSNWVLLGINTKNEITQVVLNDKVSSIFSNSFQKGRSDNNCVSREQAILTVIFSQGKQNIKFGNF